jgi:hypothetical protein
VQRSRQVEPLKGWQPRMLSWAEVYSLLNVCEDLTRRKSSKIVN